MNTYKTTLDISEDLLKELSSYYKEVFVSVVNGDLMELTFYSYSDLKNFFIGQKYFDFDNDIENGLIETI